MGQYLSFLIAPLLESSSTNNKNANTIPAFSLAKKKLAELQLSLVQLQQNVLIPEIILKADSRISEFLEKGGKVTSTDIAPFLEDSAFLNKIQSSVNGWIKEIQKVTLLVRDPASGTTRQEIEFWLQMERSLSAIETQLKGQDIVVTLEILKSAKRFHATVSFIADTGIKDCMEKVVKYNQLMKEFPINDLLSAPDLDKIFDALYAVLTHFTKKVNFVLTHSLK